MEQEKFGVANIPDTIIEQVKYFEKALSEKSGEEIILIAYKNEDELKD